jgi:molybdopterin converting factor small subunit
VRVELRGTIRAALGRSGVEIVAPAGGLPLSEVLDELVRVHPRAAAYLAPARSAAVLRVVHNGVALDSGDNPIVREGDDLLLLHAVAGG